MTPFLSRNIYNAVVYICFGMKDILFNKRYKGQMMMGRKDQRFPIRKVALILEKRTEEEEE